MELTVTSSTECAKTVEKNILWFPASFGVVAASCYAEKFGVHEITHSERKTRRKEKRLRSILTDAVCFSPVLMCKQNASKKCNTQYESSKCFENKKPFLSAFVPCMWPSLTVPFSERRTTCSFSSSPCHAVCGRIRFVLCRLLLRFRYALLCRIRACTNMWISHAVESNPRMSRNIQIK